MWDLAGSGRENMAHNDDWMTRSVILVAVFLLAVALT